MGLLCNPLSATLDEIKVLRGHTQSVHAVAFSMDGRYLASASRDNTVRVWDVEMGRTLRVFPWNPRLSHARGVIFSEDGTLLALGSSEEVRV